VPSFPATGSTGRSASSYSSGGSPDALYQRWIATYGGEDYGAIVRAVLALTDRVGENLSTSERDGVLRHFRTTARYEWMFWDMGHRQEQWPTLPVAYGGD
jgi:thiaminase/transcriptional activator TenA